MTLPATRSARFSRRNTSASNVDLLSLCSKALFQPDVERQFHELQPYAVLWSIFDAYRKRFVEQSRTLCLGLYAEVKAANRSSSSDVDGPFDFDMTARAGIERIRTAFRQMQIVVFGRLVIEAQAQARAAAHNAAPKDAAAAAAAAGEKKFSSETKQVLMQWFLEHLRHPYPTEAQKRVLSAKAQIDYEQVNNWFVNVRMRVWRPLVKQSNSNRSSVQKRNSIFKRTKTQETLPKETVRRLKLEIGQYVLNH